MKVFLVTAAVTFAVGVAAFGLFVGLLEWEDRRRVRALRLARQLEQDGGA